MRRRAIVAAVVTAVWSGRAWAGPAVEAQVAVDWSRVTDADVQRCGLSRLRSGTIERLIDGGYAVVGTSQPGAIGVAVSSVKGGLRIQVAGVGAARDETLALGERCDSTSVLEVIARIFELVAEVDRAGPTVREPAPAPQPVPATDWQGSVDLTARANDSPDVLLGGGIAARARFPTGWEPGARAELAGNAHLGVTVLETFLGATAAWQPCPERRRALPGARAGPAPGIERCALGARAGRAPRRRAPGQRQPRPRPRARHRPSPPFRASGGVRCCLRYRALGRGLANWGATFRPLAHVIVVGE